MSPKPRASIKDIQVDKPLTHSSVFDEARKQQARDDNAAGAGPRGVKQPGGKSGTIGVWYPAGALDLARRAYAADLADHGTPSSYTAWVEAAVIEHARRTTEQRQALTGTLEELTSSVADLTGAPGPRQLRITPQLRNLVEEVRLEDRSKGFAVSKSQWVTDAIGAAAARTLQRTGGTLAPIVGRLS